MRGSIIHFLALLGLATLLPGSAPAAIETPAAPPTAPITASPLAVPPTTSSGNSGALPYRSYRLFVQGIVFGSADERFAKAELTYNTSAGAQPLLIGPDWHAKEISVRPRRPVEYGTSYYFPVGAPSTAQRIDGKIMLTARGAGLINAPKFLESFTVALDRATISSLGDIELKGDGGSRLHVRLYSPCDFNIYETLDISGIRQAIRDELSTAGARVFSENGGGAPYSRSANAIWIGAEVPKECAELAMRVFSVNHGIPLKGVFTFNESDRGRYFFNPDSITLGHSSELSGKPDLQKAQISELFSAVGKRAGG